MYPYIIMKLSKKKIQKLYKSKNQTKKSGGKKSFKPAQTNHRSRKAGALNLRRRTLRKMKGGDEDQGEGKNDVEKTTQQTPEVVKAPEGEIKFTPEDLKQVFEKYKEGNTDDESPSVPGQMMDEQKQVSFKDLNTYKEFMTEVANLILKKLTQEYDEKMKKMKEELLEKVKEKDSATAALGDSEGKATAAQDEPAATGDDAEEEVGQEEQEEV